MPSLAELLLESSGGGKAQECYRSFDEPVGFRFSSPERDQWASGSTYRTQPCHSTSWVSVTSFLWKHARTTPFGASVTARTICSPKTSTSGGVSTSWVTPFRSYVAFFRDDAPRPVRSGRSPSLRLYGQRLRPSGAVLFRIAIRHNRLSSSRILRCTRRMCPEATAVKLSWLHPPGMAVIWKNPPQNAGSVLPME